jgi:hypothetical protein
MTSQNVMIYSSNTIFTFFRMCLLPFVYTSGCGGKQIINISNISNKIDIDRMGSNKKVTIVNYTININ